MRVSQSLDLRLAELIHELKREGVRSSKQELIEMFLSELPLQPTEDLRGRLRRYRDSVPKEQLVDVINSGSRPRVRRPIG